MGIKESLGKLIRRQPSEQDLAWAQAEQIMDKTKGKELLIVRAAELRLKDDNSAIVNEYNKDLNPYVKTCVLRWGLRKKVNKSSGTLYESRGISINASSTGDVKVCFTLGTGWYDFDTYRQLNAETRDQIEKFMQQNHSLAEKIQFAMTLATPTHDYRYDETSSIKSKIAAKRIL